MRHCLLVALLTLHASTSYGQSSLQLSSGISFSNSDLFSREMARSPASNQSEQRQGFQLALGAMWQELNAEGGYNATAYGYQDWGLDERKDIRLLKLQAGRLIALTPEWLSRTQLQTHGYDNQQQTENSYLALGVTQTLGYFAADNSGLDLSVGVEQKNYFDNPTVTYSGQELKFESVYYTAQQKSSARWAFGLSTQRFSAEQALYNSDTLQLNLSYGQWRWGELQGNNTLQWLQNSYPNSVGQLYETYSLLSWDGNYPMTKAWQLTGNLNVGLYRRSGRENKGVMNGFIGVQTEL